MLVELLPPSWQPVATVLVNGIYWPLVLIGLLLALTSFYNVVLPNRLPWSRHLPGAMLALAFFMVAALVLRTYVADVLTAALPYGALAAPIGILLFCFFFGMAVLLGAELNATIQARWPAPLRRHERRRRARREAKLAARGPPPRAVVAQSFLSCGRSPCRPGTPGCRAWGSWSPGRPRRRGPRPWCP